MTNSIFQALAEAAPSTYLKESSSGQTILRDLFQRCASGNLVPAAAVDDIARLHCIFDVALEHGMGHLVHDYLVEVSGTRPCIACLIPNMRSCPGGGGALPTPTSALTAFFCAGRCALIAR